MEVGLVQKIDIDREMQQAYLDYAMSVIVARALPDARDGLKPVHRRILYAMYDMGLRPDTPFKKSARIVGEVLGKYHPHGDMAVYEAMARMAQSFSMRYLLVDGQGNFGSVDGDPPAAMRYTEARLAPAAMDLLSDIEKNTVDFVPNFDGTLTEPAVLPAALPNLLVNGATGIAVGMATSIPPHNLGEIVDAIHYLLGHWEKLDDVSIEDLMHFVHGPDFPTGGVILHREEGEDGLVAAYSTGRGRVTVQASAHLEEMERGRNRIIVTELPYTTNKSALIERIAELVREEKLEGIADLRDESDRHGMRIVIELNKTADPEAVLRDLYRHTPMQITFSINMLALVQGEPRLLSLKQALRVYIEHRLEVVRRRSEYELAKARQRAHILEGLRVALKNLDEVIALIRNAPDVETARTRLMKRFRLSEAQAQAILEMPLRRLAALERKKIEQEYKDTLAAIKELESLLKSPKKMRQVVGEELQLVKEDFADRRRTQVIALGDKEAPTALLTTTALPAKTVWVTVTPEGLISRSSGEEAPRISAREVPAWLVKATTRDTLYLVSENGEAASLPVHALPESDLPSAGVPFHKVSPLSESEHLASVFTLPPRPARGESNPAWESWSVLTVSRNGMVKKSPLIELPGAAASTFTLVKINADDRLVDLKIATGQNDILLLTATGMAIRFSEEEVRPMGLVAAGVLGIKLAKSDAVIGCELLPQTAGEVFMIGSQGSAKRVRADQFPRQGRYGQGVIAWNLSAREQAIGLCFGQPADKVILHSSRLAPKTVRLDEAPLQTRAARGAKIFEVKSGDQLVRMTVPWQPPRPGEEPPIKTGGSPKKPSRSRAASPSAKPQQLELLPPAPVAGKTGPQKKSSTKAAADSQPIAPKAGQKSPSKKVESASSKKSPTSAASGKAKPDQKTSAAKKAPASTTKSTPQPKSTSKSGKKTPGIKGQTTATPAAAPKKKSGSSST